MWIVERSGGKEHTKCGHLCIFKISCIKRLPPVLQCSVLHQLLWPVCINQKITRITCFMCHCHNDACFQNGPSPKKAVISDMSFILLGSVKGVIPTPFPTVYKIHGATGKLSLLQLKLPCLKIFKSKHIICYRNWPPTVINNFQQSSKTSPVDPKISSKNFQRVMFFQNTFKGPPFKKKS